MKTKITYWLLVLVFMSACEKEEGLQNCLVQSSEQTLIGHEGGKDGRIRKSYTYDNQSRITEERYTDPTQNNYLVIRRYIYDDRGRLTQIINEREGLPTLYENYRYNDLGQVTTMFQYYRENNDGPEVEQLRYNYTYAAARELKTSQTYYRNELVETSAYTYTNGLMTTVKIQTPEQEEYEVEIKYDNKKSPFSQSPAILATMLNWGYPHQHNIVSVQGKYADGTAVESSFYNITYQYSDSGYPTSANLQSVYDSAHDSKLTYNYTCD